MSENLIPIKSFLGKYYNELLISSSQEKYKDTKLDLFFEQRFYIQNNKVQMIVDPIMAGYTILVSGNEIRVSQSLFDHPSITIANSLEGNQSANPRNLYNPEIFSTLAYLVCQNHTIFHIIGEMDEPIYVKYKSDYETFYSSVLVFNIQDGIDVEIVEEIESNSALNSVTNYIVYPTSRLSLTTFYQNNVSALSFCYRNIIAQDSSSFKHMMFGRGSSNIIDETKIFAFSRSASEMLGVIDSDGKKFHSILYVESPAPDYSITVNYRDILEGNSDVSFFPVILGQPPPEGAAEIEVSNITIEDIPNKLIDSEIQNFIFDIVDRAILERMTGVERFYNNKTKFLNLL